MQFGRALSRPQETPSLWRAWLVSAWPSPKWIERPEGDEGPSLWRDILVFFALLPVVLWLRINFLHRPAWAPANGVLGGVLRRSDQQVLAGAMEPHKIKWTRILAERRLLKAGG